MASIEIDSNESKLFTIFCSKITFRNILHNHTPYTDTHLPQGAMEIIWKQ